jgi:crotonobetainyl-CoA:carnitine CoA-transferase CaiB-like acyl-CoA transferase
MNQSNGDGRPFAGIKVIDLTHVLAGPYCAYQLAVLGADTVKVEPPVDGDMTRVSGAVRELNERGMAPYFLTQNSNKRSLTLDLKTEKGREILKRLIAGADVVLENYRAGAMGAIGLGYEDMKALNPTLIYCSMTGYGGTGPKAGHTAYDQVIQAASGLMSVTGTPETAPNKVGAPVIDYASGITAAFAVASALFQRAQTGRGQHIDFSMLDTTLALMGTNVTSYLLNGTLSKPPGNANPLYAASSCFETADGLLMLGAFNPDQNRRLWEALDRPDLAAIDTWHALQDNREMLADELAVILKTRTAKEWEDLLNDIPVPASRVLGIDEALSQEQIGHRGILHRHDNVPGVDGPVTVPLAAFTYDHGGPSIESPPPRLGADSDAVLGELGLGVDEITALRDEGVI